jgi:hypothetical protein
MAIVDKYRPHFTYEDYLLWEGRCELIEGMPYAMAFTHERTSVGKWKYLFNFQGSPEKKL